MPAPHVAILMASYQGAAHIGTQLESIAAQIHSNWSLVVSDDGSTDDTPDLVQDFAKQHPHQVTMVQGPRQGATQNFLSLVEAAPDDAMIAFCDQDDKWLPEKLERAATYLAPHKEPAHYAARTIITDGQLQPLTESRHFLRPLCFRNALVQAIMAGNTSVFNSSAVGLLKQAAGSARQADVISHDWWAYQVTSGAGAALWHDPRPSLLYRQHDRSEVGRNDTLPALAARMRKLMAGDFGAWMAANHNALHPMRHLLTEASRQVFDQVDRMLSSSGPQALLAMRRAGLYRQTRPATAMLSATVVAGRLRRPA
ncbi:glycosyltransferase [Paracoccus sp. JM45]|uniref:glycosyltransferase n=1 Tax=Paracoccus sp. JM45 TaxID=2283626 RepID=UPI000E6B5658|nr:glycosyltransferase [Paracoccus sp. JM45]RJE79326.1 glycosyltransferase [Paracoccus sp. JM45]